MAGPLLLVLLAMGLGSGEAPGNSSLEIVPRNSTIPRGLGGLLGAELPVLQRAFYVLSGVCLLGVLYCSVRSVRLKKNERKKYGLLSNYDESVEMGSVDSDEETVFEPKVLRR